MSFGPELLIVLLVVVVLFGSSKLPKLARSIGEAKGEFEKGMTEGDDAVRTAPVVAQRTTPVVVERTEV